METDTAGVVTLYKGVAPFKQVTGCFIIYFLTEGLLTMNVTSMLATTPKGAPAL